MDRRVACVLCQAPASSSRPDRVGYQICPRCDIGWTSVEEPVDPAGEWDREYYGNEAVLKLHLGRQSAMKAIARRLTELSPGRGRMLDVGAGLGILMKAAADEGWTVEGVEASPTAASRGRELTGAVIHEGLLEDLALPPEGFDALTCLDTLRHVRNPAGFLAHARRLLRPGGLLLIREIHRVAEQRYHRWSVTPGHAKVSGRRRAFQYGQMFSPKSLLYALRVSGMRECRVEPSPLFLEAEPGSGRAGRLMKRAIGLLGQAAYRASAGKLLLTPNLLAFGRVPATGPNPAPGR